MTSTIHSQNQKARWDGYHLSEAIRDREVLVATTQNGIYVSLTSCGLVSSGARFIRFCDCDSCVAYRLNRGRL